MREINRNAKAIALRNNVINTLFISLIDTLKKTKSKDQVFKIKNGGNIK